MHICCNLFLLAMNIDTTCVTNKHTQARMSPPTAGFLVENLVACMSFLSSTTFFTTVRQAKTYGCMCAFAFVFHSCVSQRSGMLYHGGYLWALGIANHLLRLATKALHCIPVQSHQGPHRPLPLLPIIAATNASSRAALCVSCIRKICSLCIWTRCRGPPA